MTKKEIRFSKELLCATRQFQSQVYALCFVEKDVGKRLDLYYSTLEDCALQMLIHAAKHRGEEPTKLLSWYSGLVGEMVEKDMRQD